MTVSTDWLGTLFRGTPHSICKGKSLVFGTVIPIQSESQRMSPLQAFPLSVKDSVVVVVQVIKSPPSLLGLCAPKGIKPSALAGSPKILFNPVPILQLTVISVSFIEVLLFCP